MNHVVKGGCVKRAAKLLSSILLFIFLFISFDFISVSTLENQSVTVELKKLEKDQIMVSFIPLEIGEATLIQLENNDFYLIDTGYTETAEDLVAILQDHGVAQLKGLFLTNPFPEHFGGFPFITEYFPIETIYLPVLTANTFQIPNHLKAKIKQLKANDRVNLLNNVNIYVLSPFEPLSLSPQANSMVLQLVDNDISFLFTSDIDSETENKLLNKYNLKSEILKVSDFGSNSASAPEFIVEVDAQVAIIFSGNPELNGLSDDVLERLHESWIDVFILKRIGEVQIISDGTDYSISVVKDE